MDRQQHWTCNEWWIPIHADIDRRDPYFQGSSLLLIAHLILILYTIRHDMWCDLGESVKSWTCDISSFVFDWRANLERYILLKTPLESVQWFQGYEQIEDSQNNRKQCISSSGYISQSILPTSDWSRFITTHMCVAIVSNSLSEMLAKLPWQWQVALVYST